MRRGIIFAPLMDCHSPYNQAPLIMIYRHCIWIILSLFSFGCKESPIQIPELGVGTRKVLVEELSGVNCTNCPDGARELAKIQTALGKDKVILISIYPSLYGILSRPYNDSKYDFRIKEGDDLVKYLGVADGIPAVSANRTINNVGAVNPFMLSQTQWGGIIRDQLQEEPAIEMFMENTYDAASRTLDVQLNMSPLKTLTGEHRLTVLITQDSIIDAQNDKGTKVKEYVHRHVLRKILTQPSGDVLTEALTVNALITRKMTFVLPEVWEAKHCEVVAFVHRSGTPDFEVLQAIEKALIE